MTTNQDHQARLQGKVKFSTLAPANEVKVGVIAWTELGPYYSDGANWLSLIEQRMVMRLYNVTYYGAAGNGVSRKLSAVYATLSFAQQRYPSAASLNEELDFNAERLALELCAANGGGTVYKPAGHYMWNNAAAPNSGCLVLPEARLAQFSPRGVQVNLLGDGQSTIVEWPAAPTTMKFGISCGDPTATAANTLGRYAALGQYNCTVKGFEMAGPEPVGALGASVTAFQAIARGDRCTLEDLEIHGFHIGVNQVGGQARAERLRITDCYYDVYYDDPSVTNFGDLLWDRVTLGRGRMAALGCHPNANIIASDFIDSFLGTSPYAIHKEAGAGTATYWQRILSMCTFRRTQFEDIGNAMIGEGNATKIAQAYATVIDGESQFSWNATYKIAAVAKNALIEIDQLEQFAWRDISEAHNMTPGAVATISVTRTKGAEFSGDVQKMLDVAAAAGKPFFISTMLAFDSRSVKLKQLTDSSNWEGSFAYLWNTGTLFDVSGEFGVGATGAGKGCSLTMFYDNVKLDQGTTADAFAGIAATSAQHSNFVPLITKTSAPVVVRVEAAVTVANNAYVKAGLTGYGVAASGPADGRAIGWCTNAAADNGYSQTFRCALARLAFAY